MNLKERQLMEKLAGKKDFFARLIGTGANRAAKGTMARTGQNAARYGGGAAVYAGAGNSGMLPSWADPFGLCIKRGLPALIRCWSFCN